MEPERRVKNIEDHQELLHRLTAVERGLIELKESLALNNKNTAELVAIFNGSKSFVNGLGHFAKWLTSIASTFIILGALIYAVRHGSLPNGVSINGSP